ncbi:MAG: Single-stranded DNA-binding protein [Candidatus Magasanikbacteria bacterium GW2011_GWA2_46_17]|uniref:Single-stranded DNA-binding protein n=1 Tax=Candidatus Magasanikbacteria bacterium GW2011_GWA2_46_17 TaxID=1619042 RepID=A0A0G1NYY3_9BACT|nr:MAG: Single-stranded DNA-binding protein [Candidatus Magasanikbacteria bacterium GW2011_GWA2_46_17]
MYINKAFLYGNLTKDPELKSLPSGTQVASFGLATNRVYKDKDGAKQEAVDFHNIVIFGKQAEVAAQYLKKGRPVFIEGRIQNRSWDGQDGQKKYRSEVVVERFQFGPSVGQGSGNYQKSAAGVASPSELRAADKSESPGGIEYPTEEINPEDIPF